jgi:hypothetical protein
LNIIETDFRLGKQLYSNISNENLPLSSVQSNRAVFFRIARLYHTAAHTPNIAMGYQFA